MISKTALARSAQFSGRQLRQAGASQTRAFASPAVAGSFDTTEVNGVKIAARNSHGPTTKLAVVAKAGTRYQPLPGLATGLETFAFKNTQKRSGLRIIRESELLGSQLKSYHTREALVIEANFLRDDLPYFAELLAEVVTQTKYTSHEFHEEVQETIRYKQQAASANPAALALDGVHAVAYHHGLGSPFNITTTAPTKSYLSEYSIADFASAAYAKPNFAVVAEGASVADVAKWADQFKSAPAASSGKLGLNTAASQYFGGEQRTTHSAGNSLVIGFPGSDLSTSAPAISVLAALLNGHSHVKWSPGFSLLSKAIGSSPGLSISTKNLAYSDAGLFTIQLTGPAIYVRKAAEEAVKAIKSISEGSVSNEDLTKAIARAKFDALEAAEGRDASLLLAGSGLVQAGKPIDIVSAIKPLESVTAEKLKTAAKSLLEGKASVAAVGDLYVLPYAEEIGLRV